MKQTIILFFLFACYAALAQTTVTPDSAKYHEGSLTTVCGKVFDTHTGRGGVMKLNFGGAYPDNTFSAVIFSDDVAKFKPAEYYSGKKFCVTGKIQLWKGSAEIILKDPDQLKEQ
jgi:hypothetical protein